MRQNKIPLLTEKIKEIQQDHEIVVQAVNSHREGPLSDIMVGQTKEAGNFP